MNLDALIEKFRAVALDRVETMNVLLVDIERERRDESVAELQREIHTLKGEAKMMGFADVNLVSHLTEHLILDATGRGFDVPAFLTETMFEGLDLLRALLTKGPGGAGAPIDLAGFVDRVAEARRLGDQPESEPSDAFGKRVRTSPRKRLDDESMLRLQTSGSARIDMSKLERLGEFSGELLLTTRRMSFQLSEYERLKLQFGRLRTRLDAVLPKAYAQELRALGHELDAWASELRALVGQSEQWGVYLDGQTRELRHLPLEHALQHYPRAVRDLAMTLNKRVRFEQDVAGVEVDRLVLNALADPLLHLIRNAVDHGIEPPQVRAAQGKHVEGRVRLSAEMAGDSVRVRLEDDGAGIDPEALARRAVERGLIDAAEAAEMGVGERLALIFEPGFTTRDTVTDLSGRGIGMDVVRRQIGAIGGTVELDSEPGRGTTFTLVLPVSSAVGTVLEFLVDGQRYAIAAKDIERVEFVPHEELIDGAAVVVDRETMETIPLLDWRKFVPAIGRETPRGRVTLLIVRRGSRAVALWVDDILGEREAMTRPLGAFLAGVRHCRGVAVTNAGDAVPLLNVNELLSPDLVVSLLARRPVRETMELSSAPRPGRVLIVEDSEITRALIAQILRDAGMTVVTAEDGWAGWELLQRQTFDVVLSDVQMPRLDGLGLLERIRGHATLAELPVVLLTTVTELAVKERANQLGVSAYLGKLAFDERELVETVRGLVGRHGRR